MIILSQTDPRSGLADLQGHSPMLSAGSADDLAETMPRGESEADRVGADPPDPIPVNHPRATYQPPVPDPGWRPRTFTDPAYPGGGWTTEPYPETTRPEGES